ncbi:TonB C-terminal domain-containing protein [Idiomarina sp. FeN1]|uniref:TonB C-terminal domain-containing protein n=2 Tax=Idiomarina TaxID=135575 RepID=UPI00129C9541|nr:hypothetical protein [Idiomarina sp. FeN1]NCU58812.1 hypothetical protein [Idiomarina sp. FenA--70]NCU61521.1 hypothetical protein [Idiomarina sp. FenBw--71]
MRSLLIGLSAITLLFSAVATSAETRRTNHYSPMSEYTASIFKAVKQYLPSESEARQGVSCKVSFRQNRSGYIQEIKVIECSDGTTSNLLIQALAKASPMPQPTRPGDFQEEVTIVYSPQQLP